MKKVLLPLALVAFVFAGTSCKKDYTCECTFTQASQTKTESFPYQDVKKDDAEEACEALDVIYTTGTCELK